MFSHLAVYGADTVSLTYVFNSAMWHTCVEQKGCGFKSKYSEKKFPDEIRLWFVEHAEILGIRTRKDNTDLPCEGTHCPAPRALKLPSPGATDRLWELFGNFSLAAHPMLQELKILRAEMARNREITTACFEYIIERLPAKPCAPADAGALEVPAQAMGG